MIANERNPTGLNNKKGNLLPHVNEKAQCIVASRLFGSRYTKDEARNVLVLLSSVWLHYQPGSPEVVAKISKATPGL